MSIDVQKRRSRERLVYVLAVILMIIRVDIWWWGEEMPLVVAAERSGPTGVQRVLVVGSGSWLLSHIADIVGHGNRRAAGPCCGIGGLGVRAGGRLSSCSGCDACGGSARWQVLGIPRHRVRKPER